MEDNRLKQRIVGAVVLVALAVIFIPMLLTEGTDSELPIFGANIPPKPENIARIKTLELEHPQQPPTPREIVRTPIDEKSPKQNTLAKKPVAEASPPTAQPLPSVQKAPAAAPTIKAWAVQVGSFSKQMNALALRDKLRKKGYTAFVEKVTSKEGQVYRVRVGPEIRRRSAEKMQKKLKTQMKLDGLVVAHP